jgi:hypothetical protein
MFIIHRHQILVLFATSLMVAGLGRPALSQGPAGRGLIERAKNNVANPILIDELNQYLVNRYLDRFGHDESTRNVRLELIKQQFDSILRSRVEFLAKSYGLSNLQKKKLMVGGQGDIKRYCDSVEEIWRSLDVTANDPDKTRDAIMEIERLERVHKSGMFKNGSIFAKTLQKTLSDEQIALYKEKNRQQYRETLTWVTGTLEQTLKLSANQRRRLERVLTEETRAPGAFGGYDYYGVIFQAARIPEARLKPIFDDDQWQVLSRQFQEVRGMEQTLADGGFIPIEERANSLSPTPNSRPIIEPEIHPIGR